MPQLDITCLHVCFTTARQRCQVLYGSVAPEISGNIDDDVGEILDMCTTEEEALDNDEREVIVLRDVDDDVAQEVVQVIGSMSREEADEKGGKSLSSVFVFQLCNVPQMMTDMFALPCLLLYLSFEYGHTWFTFWYFANRLNITTPQHFGIY